MLKRLGAALFCAAALVAGQASADQICGADVHSRFGETRAYFRDVLAACRPDGYCSAVVALADPSHSVAFLQQLRVARARAGANYVVSLDAVVPMPAEAGVPMGLKFGARSLNISQSAPLAANSGNEFEIADTAIANDIVTRLKRVRSVTWTYQGTGGRAQARFPLRGMTDALSWVDCMGARH
jgi:hypothetical protein